MYKLKFKVIVFKLYNTYRNDTKKVKNNCKKLIVRFLHIFYVATFLCSYHVYHDIIATT